MSTEETTGGGLPLGLIAGVAVVVLALAGLVTYLSFSAPRESKSGSADASSRPILRDNNLDQAREVLNKVTDLNACRSALQLVGAHLAEEATNRPPVFSDDQRKRLLELVALRPDELAEIEGAGYSQLDAHHLESRFLFQEAAAAVGIGTVATGSDRKSLSATERAKAAFAWAVRQVRLSDQPSGLVPASLAVRKGVGTALDRALVFLALLDGIGAGEGRLSGCLLWLPGQPGAPASLWACGVLAEGGKDIYLLDPRLGLPLPSPDGKGVATLADVRKDPAALAALNLDESNRYDVTPAQVEKVELTLIRPLSALSPRMRFLQEHLLGPTVRAPLADDLPAEVAAWTAAVKALGDAPPTVRVWREGVSLQRDFLPKEEGGTDGPRPFRLAALRGYTVENDPLVVEFTRKRLFEMSLVPWSQFPLQFRDPGRFSYRIPLGQRVRDSYARPFIRTAMEPAGPRDLMLRGRYSLAAEQLVPERDTAKELAALFRNQSENLTARVDEWLAQAIPISAKIADAELFGSPDLPQLRKQMDELWRTAEAVRILMGGALAGPRNAEATYLLGLCKQEEAEQLQARLDMRSGRGTQAEGSADARAKARTAWKTALYWWRTYTEENPTGASLAAVRRLQARAEAQLGNTQAAVVLLEDVSTPMTPLEKLANLHEARRLKQVKSPP